MMCLGDRSVGEVLHFITIAWESFAFLPRLDVGKDPAVERPYHPSLPFAGNVQTSSLLASPAGLMGFSKPVDSEVAFMFGSSWRRQMPVSFCYCRA